MEEQVAHTPTAQLPSLSLPLAAGRKEGREGGREGGRKMRKKEGEKEKKKGSTEREEIKI